MALVGLAFKGAQLAVTAEMMGLDLDYTSIVKWGYCLTRAASKLAVDARAVDERALAEMVDLAQSRAPLRSGRLRAGITGEREGEVMVFRAAAQLNESTADYAPFVERGTRGGNRGRQVVDATYFERAHARARKSRRTHPGTAAQPFFYSSAEEVLARRRVDQAAVMARATAEDQEG